MKVGLLLAPALAVGACGGASSAPGAGPCGAADAIWVASDYSSSAAGAVALPDQVSATVGRVDLGADPVLAVSRGRAFLVARDQDLVFELEGACGTPSRRWSVHPASASGSSNPQGVAVAADGSLWVPLYDVPAIAILSPAGGGLRTIDLSAYDPDGNPNASAIAIAPTPAGEKAFVTLQRLNDADGLKSEQPSWMLRIDVARAEVEGHVELAGRNPFTVLQDGAILWLAEPGNFDDASEAQAGIERFDTATSTGALVAREVDLGGSVAEVAVAPGCAAAIVAGPTHDRNPTALVTFDPATGAVATPLARSPLATAGFDVEGLTWAGTTLLVGDRRRAGAGYPIHAFSRAAGCALTPGDDRLFTPLPLTGIHALR